MKNSKETLKVIGTLSIGVITGIILGVLFAPDKGRNARDKFSGKTKRLDEDSIKRIKDDIIAFRSRADELEKLTEK